MPDEAALLVPAFNAAAYLPRLAAAARASERPFSEWICYDDGSTDTTTATARSLGFRILTGAGNRGPSHARNRLTEAASADWLHFHDADDLFASTYLAEALAEAGPHCDVVICNSSWELETTRERILHWTYEQEPCDADPLGYVLTHPVGVISALIRRSLFRDIGGFDETKTCWEDADLFVRLAEHGARFKIIPKTLVTSLRHDRGISRDQLHCDHCRLEFLRGYARRHPTRLRPLHAAEAEKLIKKFLEHRDPQAADDALAFCRAVGGNPPTTTHPVLQALKRVVPALWLIRLQDLRRKAAR